MKPKERGIIFSGAMVRAILEGRKTQTRRVLKDPSSFGCLTGDCPHETQVGCDVAIKNFANYECPYGRPGERLWVRETFAYEQGEGVDSTRPRARWAFKSDYDNYLGPLKWTPAIHMPRWASRLTLEVTGVRVEQLQDISEADALAEGCKPHVENKWWQGYHKDDSLLHQVTQDDGSGKPPGWLLEAKPYRDLSHLNRSAKREFQSLWDSLNAKRGYAWETNPWVWVLEFKRL